jgi:hypothetical protein
MAPAPNFCSPFSKQVTDALKGQRSVEVDHALGTQGNSSAGWTLILIVAQSNMHVLMCTGQWPLSWSLSCLLEAGVEMTTEVGK